MKHVLYVLFVLLIINSGVSQETFKVDTIEVSEFKYHPDIQVKKATSEILKCTGLKPNFVVLESDVKTAKAVVRNGNRIILYNPEFILRLKNETLSYWGVVSVLAHEVGHHLLGHTIKQYDYTKKDELGADEFSGFVLNNMGATLAESCYAINMYREDLDTTTHPCYSERVKAISKGYNNAGSSLNSKFVFIENSEGKVSLLFKSKFIGDDDVYFVDEKGRVVWFDYSGNALVYGEKKEANLSGYKWMFTYKDECYYVDENYAIWNKSIHGTVSEIGTIIKLSLVSDKNTNCFI